MSEILFILGLPGSGKSAIARHIGRYVRNQGRGIKRFNDYRILHEMFRQDAEKKQFKSAEPEGFDVIDENVFDKALHELEWKVKEYLSSSKATPRKIIIIEFARNNYRRAFEQFSSGFLQSACFLYLDVEVEVCKQRIRTRAEKPKYKDDYPVSEYIFETYYYGDDGEHISWYLENNHKIEQHRVLALDNNGTLKSVGKRVNSFIDAIMSAEVALNKNR